METMTTIIDIMGLKTGDAPAVRWEPCTELHEAADGTCAGCGWLADDHQLATAA